MVLFKIGVMEMINAMSVYTIKQHRLACLTILLVPAIAVTVAMILIVILRPSKLIPLTIVIGIVLIQYLGLVAYIWRRLHA